MELDLLFFAEVTLAGLIEAGHASDVVAPIVGHRRGEGLVRLSALR